MNAEILELRKAGENILLLLMQMTFGRKIN